MTETEAPARIGYQPGPGELAALRYMNEIEPSSRVPTKHIVAQKIGFDTFQAFEWQPRRRSWVEWKGVPPNSCRRVMVDAMLAEIGWANLTIMDEPVDFADYEGFTPAEFDHCVFCVPHVMMCPTSEPGGIERWASFGVNGKGVGSSLGGGHAHPGNDGPIFQEMSLAVRYRRVALPVETGPLGREDAQRVPPALLRHDRVARQVVPKSGWGIVGRPDLLSRQTDREVAIRAAAEAEMERQHKAGEWLAPPLQVYQEIAIRMQKEWEAQDRVAARAA